MLPVGEVKKTVSPASTSVASPAGRGAAADAAGVEMAVGGAALSGRSASAAHAPVASSTSSRAIAEPVLRIRTGFHARVPADAFQGTCGGCYRARAATTCRASFSRESVAAEGDNVRFCRGSTGSARSVRPAVRRQPRGGDPLAAGSPLSRSGSANRWPHPGKRRHGADHSQLSNRSPGSPRQLSLPGPPSIRSFPSPSRASRASLPGPPNRRSLSAG